MRQQIGIVKEVSKKNRQTFTFDKPEIERLFGIDKRNEKRIEDEDFNAGRLRFFPTFFKQIGLEVINPHLRKTGAGDKPIQFETARGDGRFNLFYFPFDFDQSPQAYSEVADDLILIARAVREMFTVYGFGAKTSSGFGIADVIKDGKLRMRLDDVPEIKSTGGERCPDDLAKFFTPEGMLKEFTESEMNGWGKPRRQQYGRAKRWLERKQAELATTEALPASAKPVTERPVLSWQGLIDKAEEIAARLRVKGGEKE
jgi:CRISPR-associated protein Cmr2